MTDSARPSKPYVWVTWITGLLAGVDRCEWKAWYKSHYRYAKLPKDGDGLDQWQLEHDEMTGDRNDALREDGWTVSLEEANAFKLNGRSAILAGKPDILARRDQAILVVDEKSGSPKPQDEWQVLLYMFALPLVGIVDRVPNGEVQYRGSSLLIPAERLDASAKSAITKTMQMVGAPQPPVRTPSQKECAFCDIAACPDRIETNATVGETEAF